MCRRKPGKRNASILQYTVNWIKLNIYVKWNNPSLETQNLCVLNHLQKLKRRSFARSRKKNRNPWGLGSIRAGVGNNDVTYGRQSKFFCSGTQWGGNCPHLTICPYYKKLEEKAWIFLPIPKMIQDFTNDSVIRSTCRRMGFTSCHTHQVLHNFPLFLFQGISHLLLVLVGHCMQGMYIQTSNHTHRHIKPINLLKINEQYLRWWKCELPIFDQDTLYIFIKL